MKQWNFDYEILKYFKWKFQCFNETLHRLQPYIGESVFAPKTNLKTCCCFRRSRMRMTSLPIQLSFRGAQWGNIVPSFPRGSLVRQKCSFSLPEKVPPFKTAKFQIHSRFPSTRRSSIGVFSATSVIGNPSIPYMLLVALPFQIRARFIPS